MTRRSTCFLPLAALAITGMMLGSPRANAQNEAVLAEVYGQGVHAFYAGQLDQAYKYLSSAIDGGTRDPRAYYFRGIVDNCLGRPFEAEADWIRGAKLEATYGGGGAVGQSLTRFQGADRLKLEEIRQKARLEAMISGTQRSDQRLEQLDVRPGNTPPPPVANRPPAVKPAPAPPAAPAADDPFADDGPAIAGGQPKVDSTNALEGLDDNPFKDDAPAAAGDATDAVGNDANPFGDAPATDADTDPFGAGAGESSDPFGAPADGTDPFGGDPFGN